jgi:hypothetical protein
VPLAKKIRKTITKTSKKPDNEVNRKVKPVKKSKDTSDGEDDP